MLRLLASFTLLGSAYHVAVDPTGGVSHLETPGADLAATANGKRWFGRLIRRVLGHDTTTTTTTTTTSSTTAPLVAQTDGCTMPTRNTPTPEELTTVGFKGGVLAMFSDEDWGVQPTGYENSPTRTGVISNVAELNQALRATYNEGKYGPVSISKVTVKDAAGAETEHYLVLIAGTEVSGPVWEFSNDALANVPVFFNPEKDSVVRKNARYAIRKEVPKGSSLVIVGHSQGGMIAFQLSSDPVLKEEYEIARVMTFGSPWTPMEEESEGSITMFEAPADPVPKIDEVHDVALKICSTLPLVRKLCDTDKGERPETVEIPTFYNIVTKAIFSHNCDYVREDNAVSKVYDAMGRKDGGATMHFVPAERVFYTSPEGTCAA